MSKILISYVILIIINILRMEGGGDLNSYELKQLYDVLQVLLDVGDCCGEVFAAEDVSRAGQYY